MSLRPNGADQMDKQRYHAGSGDAVSIQTRVAMESGASVYVNIPKLATEFLNIEVGDELVVEIQEGGLFVKPKAAGDVDE